MLSEKPLHVRKRIALFWTGGVALALVLVLILMYAFKSDDQKGSEPNPFGDFYKTILRTTQSFFSEK